MEPYNPAIRHNADDLRVCSIPKPIDHLPTLPIYVAQHCFQHYFHPNATLRKGVHCAKSQFYNLQNDHVCDRATLYPQFNPRVWKLD